MSLNLMSVGKGLQIEDGFAIIEGVGIPGFNGGTPDEVLKGSLYINSTDTSLWKKHTNGIGPDKWQDITNLSSSKRYSNFTEVQVIDYIFTDEINIAKWLVEVSLASNESNRYVCEITAIHNGTDTSDATEVSNNIFSILNLGTAIPGLLIETDLSGTGVNQAINLEVSASVPINVVTRRLTYGESITGMTGLDIRGIPHDLSSTIIGNIAGNETVLFFISTRSYQIPANFINSRAVCDTVGSIATQFTILYCPIPAYTPQTIGTITFNANAKTGIISGSGNLSIQPGDIIKVVSPTLPAGELKTICITIQAHYM